MPADDRQTLSGDLADQLLQPLELSCPLLDLRGQRLRHVHGARLAGLLEGQLPCRRFTPRPLNLTERAFYKDADLPNLPEIGLPESMVSRVAGLWCVHMPKYYTLALWATQKRTPKNFFFSRPRIGADPTSLSLFSRLSKPKNV